MSRIGAKFTQSDLNRAIRAVKASGGTSTIELSPEGTIRILPARPAQDLLTQTQDKATPSSEAKPMVF